MSNGQRVALRDVALRAGVSVGTASNVFAGKTYVAPETRALVLTAAEELGYRPRPRAADMTPTAVTTLGLVIRAMPDPFPTNPFYSHVLHGVEQACAERGLSLLYAIADEHASRVEHLPPMVYRRQAQGLLAVGYFPPAIYTVLRDVGLPFVLVDHRVDDIVADSVTGDNERGGYLATRHLMERRRGGGGGDGPTAMIAGPLYGASMRQRLAGYRRAIEDEGLPYDEGYVWQGDGTMADGYAAMRALRRRRPAPTAVFCCNDVTAIGAMKALRESGVSIPDECAIAGFDDIELAAHTVPPLTTVRVDKGLLGSEGVRSLLERIAHPNMAARHTQVGVALIERGTA